MEQSFYLVAPYFPDMLTYIVVCEIFVGVVILGNDSAIVSQRKPQIIIERLICYHKIVPPFKRYFPSGRFQICIVAFRNICAINSRHCRTCSKHIFCPAPVEITSKLEPVIQAGKIQTDIAGSRRFPCQSGGNNIRLACFLRTYSIENTPRLGDFKVFSKGIRINIPVA